MSTPPSGRRRSRAWLAAGVILAAAASGACSDDSGDEPASQPPPQPTVEEVGPVAARYLCDMLHVDTATWREHPDIGLISFEGHVRTWAAEYENFEGAIIRDHAFVDDLTIHYCPEVRERALDALGLDTLSSGLIGYT
ncbi:hypothetical protein FEK35_23540 [Nocardia cyriacigeorgica]|uniref:DUF732 domain-containing protein n=1 Tax=Nocardia cyriacigeorgica TaxID=135487 RepID=A0A5R8P8I1_9NOCA|nr:hypothetical protein [Nocardia cyriacigeorgica]TLG01681.1 hypothetical protein FEK35_23540 [Nocardia cyriacigeorgica]